MKTTLCCLFILFIAVKFSKATVHNVCNMGYNPGMHATFDDAQTAAIDGDTIYVHGSSINYGFMLVFKRLVIIGPGHNPENPMEMTASFTDVFFGVDEVQIIGLTFTVLGSPEQNCVVKKCRIIGASGSISMFLFDASGWLIEGNIFDFPHPEACITLNGTAAPNLVIQNNIFATPGTKIAGIYNSISQRSSILNNIFLGNNLGSTFSDVYYLDVDNNIFYRSSPDQSGSTITGGSMNHNISYLCDDNLFYLPGMNNLGGNSPTDDPQFVNFSGFPVFDYDFDFRLQATSPGYNTGSDGTDRGVFGGIGFRFTTTGEPSIAVITTFTINGPTVISPGGTLNITVTSKRVN